MSCEGLTIKQTVAEQGLFAGGMRAELRSLNIKLTHVCKGNFSQGLVSVVTSFGVGLSAIVELALTTLELLVMVVLAPIASKKSCYKEASYYSALKDVATQASHAALRTLAPLTIVTGLLGSPLRIEKPLMPPPSGIIDLPDEVFAPDSSGTTQHSMIGITYYLSHTCWTQSGPQKHESEPCHPSLSTTWGELKSHIENIFREKLDNDFSLLSVRLVKPFPNGAQEANVQVTLGKGDRDRLFLPIRHYFKLADTSVD